LPRAASTFTAATAAVSATAVDERVDTDDVGGGCGGDNKAEGSRVFSFRVLVEVL